MGKKKGNPVDSPGLTIADLTGAAYNPRKITDGAASGLAKSIESFGDISGVVYNKQTGNLVSGHQRVAQLRKLGAQMVDDKLVITVQGERREFSVRVVDWTEGQEKAANVAANNPHIGGTFTEGLADILAEVQCDLGDLAFEDLRLDELLSDAGVFDAEAGDLPDLPTDDDPAFHTMSFVISRDQKIILDDAIEKAKAAGGGDDPENTNTNGNCISFVAAGFLNG